ncbi:MAG TPA: hypothetical protein DDZ66_08540 [Firmicutes bacterium]|nr:hypothetical protein [Bacillota bacterium]
MNGRSMRVFLVIVTVFAMLVSGCLFGGLKNVVSLELAASDSTVAFGEAIELSALGTTKTGRAVSVKPTWEIVVGSGTVGASNFQASDWDYEGDVTLRATYNGVASEITITVAGLLRDYEDPFPTPTSPWVSLPSKTDSQLVKIGDPVDFFSNSVYLRMNGRIIRGWGRFVWDGEIMLPDDPSPATWANSLLNQEIPEIPRLSHRVHFEQIESQILDRGTNFKKTVSHRQGTTIEQSQELVKRLTSETTAKAQWGWGEIETTLTAEITSRTQQSVKVEREETVTREWSFIHPNDFDIYLYSSWNKVDTFYLSDSNGVPLEKSPIFEGYGFSSCPVEIRGGVVVQKTWGFNN